MKCFIFSARILLAMAILQIGHHASAQSANLLVELNKLEASEEPGCRSFFLFRNGLDIDFDGFEISLAILKADGVIDRLLTIDAAPLPANRTSLRLFDIPEMACPDVTEIILHDIPVCSSESADVADCYGLIDLQSRTGAKLVR